jgi:hypothetical protein
VTVGSFVRGAIVLISPPFPYPKAFAGLQPRNLYLGRFGLHGWKK